MRIPGFIFNYSAKQNTSLIKRTAVHFSGDKHEPPPETIPTKSTVDKGDSFAHESKTSGIQTSEPDVEEIKRAKRRKEKTVYIADSREYDRRGSGAHRTTVTDTFDAFSGQFVRKSSVRHQAPFDGNSTAF